MICDMIGNLMSCCAIKTRFIGACEQLEGWQYGRSTCFPSPRPSMTNF